MLVTIGLWVTGASIVALSLECLGAACALFVCGALLIRLA